MDFDFTTETILPENTDILTIGGTGAIRVPSGTVLERPVTGLDAGLLRWNEDGTYLEMYNGTAWVTAGGSVTSVDLTAGTGISVSGGPITTSGTITVTNTGVTSAVAGTGISVSGGTGAVTFTNTGVTSLAGTPDQVIVSASTGAVTLSLPQSIGTTSSPTFTSVTITGTPTAGTDVVHKNYVDSAISGLSWKQSVRASTTVGGDIATAYEAGQVIDGVTLVAGDRILIKNQLDQTENGIYVVSASGAPVRAADTNTGDELLNATVYVEEGTTRKDTGWVQTTNAPITIGTSNIVFIQFSGTGSYTAGTGLTLVGNEFSLTAPVTTALGGTGTTTAPAAGQFLYSAGGTTYSATNLSGFAVTTFSGGTTGLTPSSATSGAITLGGTLGMANGGTNANLTAVAGGIVYSGSTQLNITAAGTSGQYLRSNGTSAPTWVTLTNGGLQLYAENPSAPTAPSATGTNALALGSGSTATATTSVAIGNGSNATLFGAKALANGSTATAGDAQEVMCVVRNTTTNATATELYLDGTAATQKLVLPNNSAWTAVIKVVARRTDTTGALGSWTFLTSVFRDATPASTSIAGTSKTTISRVGLSASNDPVLSADTTNGALRVTVTGNSGQTIRWVASVQFVQVTN